MIQEIKKTNRGFKITKFADRYGSQCSLQESSAMATDEQGNMIWLGVENPKGNFKVLIPGQGWQERSIQDFVKEEFVVPDRMHLTQQMVKELLPALQYFAETGELPD